MKSLFAAAIAAAALATAVPASAASIVFDFGAPGGTVSGSPATYSRTVSGVQVTATAYNGLSALTNWVFLGSQANVHRNGNGLGVEGGGNNQINDQGFLSTGEGILLTFANEVTLTQAVFTNFDAGESVGFEWGSPINGGGIETLDTLAVNAGGVFNGSFTGTQFFFAANSFSSQGFRLDAITIAAVPEPAAWLTMILGFGLVGGAMRRKPAARVRYTMA